MRNLYQLIGCNTKKCLTALAIFFTVATSVAQTTVSFTNSSPVIVTDDAYNGTLASMGASAVTVSGIPAGATITNIRVVSGLTHTWIGDVTLKLQSPDLTVLGLMSRPGYAELADDGAGCCGSSDNLVSTSPITFSDAGLIDAETMGGSGSSNNVCASDGECSFFGNPGTIATPPSAFAGLYGGTMNGTWTLYMGDAAAGDVGSIDSWTLEITYTLSFDFCGGAIPLTCNSVETGSTTTATVDGPPLSCSGGSIAADVWYTYVGTGNPFIVSLCGGTNYDSKLDIYTGTCGALTSVVCNDDFCGLQSQVTVNSTLGVTYYIRVHGFGGATGDFTLTMLETTLPSITCPGNVSVSADAGLCTASGVTLGSASASDDCFLASVANNAVEPYALGTTTVTWSATDASGNVATCPQTVTVLDDVDPIVDCNNLQLFDNGPLVNNTGSGGVMESMLQNVSLGMTLFGFGHQLTANNRIADDFTITASSWTINDIAFYAYQTGSGTTSTITAVNLRIWDGVPGAGGSNVVWGDGVTNLLTSSVWSGIYRVTETSSGDVQRPIMRNTISLGGVTLPAGTYWLDWQTDGSLASGPWAPPVTINGQSATGNGLQSLAGGPYNPAMDIGQQGFPFQIFGTSTLTYPNDAGLCNAALSITETPTYSDLCSSISSVVNDFNSTANASGTYNVGTTTVTWSVTDAAGNVGTCSFNVVVTDEDVPTITCPSDVTISTDAGMCTSTASYGSPTTTDNCPGAIVTNNAPSTLPLGTTVVVWTVTDGAGNTATCTQNVTVQDNEIPVISCNNISVNNDPGVCNAVVNFVNPTATDNCPGAPTVTQIGGPVSGSTFPLGNTTISFMATDAAGNTATCTQTVTVTDGEAPVFSVCAPSTLKVIISGSGFMDEVGWTMADGNGGIIGSGGPYGSNSTNETLVNGTGGPYTFFAETQGTFNDNVINYSVICFSGTGSGTVLASGTVVGGSTQTESGLCCEYVAGCPLAATFSNDPGLCSAVVSLALPTVIDNCGSTTVSNDGPSSYPVGTTTITWTATDASGNTSTCTQDVTITDTELPTITCPSDVTVSTDAGLCTASGVNLGTPTINDNCPGATAGNNAPSIYPLGVTSVVWTVTDNAGNVAICSQMVTVTDGGAPVFNCPVNVSVNTDPGLCSAVVNYTTPTAIDNCPTTQTFTQSTDNNTITAGATAACNSGGLHTDNSYFRVYDLNSIGHPSGNDLNVTGIRFGIDQAVGNGGSQPAEVRIYTLSGPFVMANLTLVASQSITIPDQFQSIFVAPITATVPGGSTMVVEIFTPDGQSAGHSFFFGSNGNGQSGISYIMAATCGITEPTDIALVAGGIFANNHYIIDVIAGEPVVVTQTAGLASGSTFPVGTTTNTFEATDGAGNTSTCSFDVIVNDAESPTIACPSDVTVSADAGLCSASGVVLGTATTGDNCGVATTTNDAPTTFAVGATTVTWTVTDNSGNTATCTQTVTVTGGVSITCPSNVNAGTDAGSCSAVVNYPAPTTTVCGNVSIPYSGSPVPTVDNSTVTATENVSAFGPTTTLGGGTSLTSVCFQINHTWVGDLRVVLQSPNGTQITLLDRPGYTGTGFGCSSNDLNMCINPGTGAEAETVCSVTPPAISGNYTAFAGADLASINNGGLANGAWQLLVTDNAGGDGGSVVGFTLNFGTSVALTQTTGLASGSAFPVGTTTNTFVADDGNGNTATCSFDVTVTDDDAPSITCPADVTVSADAGLCTASGVNLGNPVATDNCGVASTVNNAPSTYSLGANTVTWTVTDNSGNTSTCTQTVTVLSSGVTITCPAAVAVNTDPGLCSAVVNYTAPVGTDLCGGGSNQFVLDYTGAPVPIPDNGNTSASLATSAFGANAILGGNVNLQSVCFEVPHTWVGDVTVTLQAPDGTQIVLVDRPGTTGSGGGFGCSGDNLDLCVTTGTGNEAESVCSNLPAISGNYTAANGTDLNSINNGSSPNGTWMLLASDAVGGDAGLIANWSLTFGTSITTTQTAGLASGAIFPEGTTTNTFEAEDAYGNTATCSFDVTVNDGEIPTIACPADVTVVADAGLCSASGVVLGTATTGDNCGVATTTNDAPTTFVVGTTTVTWTVTDNSGNTATCAQQVTVTDGEAPIILCPSDITVSTGTGSGAGLCDAGVTFLTPSVSDNCSTIAPQNLSTTFAGGNAHNGNMFDVTAVNNVTVTGFDIHPQANTDVEVYYKTGTHVGFETNAGAWTLLGSATGIIAQPFGTPTVLPLSLSLPLTSGQTYAFYITSTNGGVSLNYTNGTAVGNVFSSDANLQVLEGKGVAYPFGANFSPRVWNGVIHYDGNSAAIVTQTAGLSSGSVFPLGTTTNTFVATDGAGNTSTCSFTVTVVDDVEPLIVCPSDVVVSTDPGLCTASGVSLGNPVATDNCGVASTVNNAPSTYPVGVTTVTWTVTDNSGNTATCTQNVVVVSGGVAITCPGDVTVNNDPGLCSAVVNYTTPVGGETCPGGIGQFTLNYTGSVVPIPDNSSASASLVTSAFGGGTTLGGNLNLQSVCFEVPHTWVGDVTVTLQAPDGSQVVLVDRPGTTGSGGGFGCSGDNLDMCVTTGTGNEAEAVCGNLPAIGGNYTAANGVDLNIINNGSSPNGTWQLLASDGAGGDIGSIVSWSLTFGTSIATTQTAGLASGSAFPVGATTNTFEAEDVFGNTATCSFDVTVSDVEVPAITCPAAITVAPDAGLCTASNVSLGVETTSDNCGIASVTNDAPSVFNGGNTTVTWTVTDNNGNTATCTQIVTVTGGGAFTLTCPADVNTTTDAGLCAASGVNLGTPTVVGGCGGAPTITNNAPSTYPVGTTTVTWFADDGNGNTATCSQIVTVADGEAPTITCPVAVSVSTDAGVCSASGVNLGTPTTSDNCGIASTTNDAPVSFGLGATTVTWTVTDNNGNTATCTQTVTVTDNEVPTVICPADVSVSTDAGVCSASSVNLGTPTTGDNCGIASTTNNAPVSFGLGATTVTWTVTDNNGNTATCTQTVTVTDNEVPTITCPADVSVSTDAGVCSASGVNLGTPTTGDNCGIASTTNDAPATFGLGATTVTWTVTDNNGNTATCTQTVTVTDVEMPTVSCPADIAVSTDANACSATGIALGSPVTNDNCGVATITNNAPVSFGLGTTTVIWTVTDNTGNTATCTQTVTVTDDVAPTISCPADVTVNVDANSCAATNVALGSATAADNCGSPTVTNDAPTSFSVGTTTVTWTAVDNNGNTATCTQTVTVVDNIDPTISCPANVSTNTDAGVCTATVVLGTPTTNDNCSVANVTNNAPTSFSAGTTTVVWTVVDASGNDATCSQVVTVTDAEAPTITCPSDITANTNAANCLATGVILGTPVTNDNCGVATVSNTAPTSFGIGSTTVVWTVTDINGFTATCNQVVTVVDNVPPTITCPPAVSVSTDPGGCTASNVNLGTPTTFDNCGIASVVNDAPSIFPVGNTTVTWTATDINGNTATCTQVVTVTGGGLPTIICPAAVFVNADAGLCTASGVALGTPSAAGNCGVSNVSNDAPAVYPVGNTTVTWTVTDLFGNTSSCGQTVTVTDAQVPTITCPSDVTVLADASPCVATNVTLGTPTTADNCGIAAVNNNAPAQYPVGNNNVVWTVTDVNGNNGTCVQVVTVNPNVDVTVSTTPNSLTSNASAATYQWFNCTTGSNIQGATNASYSPTSSGSYAVIVTQNGCTDTSACISFTFTGIGGTILANGFKVYPNPAIEYINIETTGLVTGTSRIQLYDVQGRLVRDVEYDNMMGVYTISLENLASAMYELRINTANGVWNAKVMKIK